MDRTDEYRSVIRQIFEEWQRWPRKEAGFVVEPVYDLANDRYLLTTVGWSNQRRIYSVLVHIDILGDKLWIQHDGTETGVATELVDAGIPKSEIVLAYYARAHRELGDFAVA